MMTRILIFITCFFYAFVADAENLAISQVFKTWPSLALQNEMPEAAEDMIEFEEADFEQIDKKVIQANKPFIPLNKKRQFTELVSLTNPNIKWRYFATAFSSSKYSGFSQGIGGTTMLIEDELFLDVEVENVQLNSKDGRYRNYEGGKYHLDTSLHWFPTDNFSLHLGFSGWVDK